MNDIPNIKTTKLVYPQVYSFTLPDKKKTEGSQKIGYSERKDVHIRLREETRTAAMQEKYALLWSALKQLKPGKNKKGTKG